MKHTRYQKIIWDPGADESKGHGSPYQNSQQARTARHMDRDSKGDLIIDPRPACLIPERPKRFLKASDENGWGFVTN